jgi:hypothetical protein
VHHLDDWREAEAMKRPELPEKMTLEDAVRWVMYAERCNRAQARKKVLAAVNDGRLPFEADQVDRDGKTLKHGVFRVRDGRVVEEH